VSTIVVGVDGSECARTALRFAAGEARVRGAGLLALRVVEVPVDAWPGSAGAVGLALEEAGRQLQADLASEPAAGDAAYEVLGGHPAEELVKAAAGADLLVVGSRGLGGFHGLLVGSVSQQCLQHAPCPVAVVRTLPDPPRGRILVGVDGSPPSVEAFEWAAEEARRRGASLGVVHGWQAPSWLASAGPIAPVPVPLDYGAAREAADEVVARLVAQAPPGVSVEPTVEPGIPAAVLVEQSGRADLLVVGSRGLGGFAGLLLGSVSQQCAHHAACPVVVVHRER
jgi:nucleotide-binding universal stress UspA family protein